jgi:hypothetical protein
VVAPAWTADKDKFDCGERIRGNLSRINCGAVFGQLTGRCARADSALAISYVCARIEVKYFFAQWIGSLRDIARVTVLPFPAAHAFD